MRIAVIGLAFTHPYSYTQILQRLGHSVTHVWDDVPERLAEFAQRFGATAVSEVGAVPLDQLDGVIVTGRLPERVDHAIYFLERGMPVYSSKPMATSLGQLKRLMETVQRTGSPLLTTSVLRYAPALRSLRRYVEEGRLGTLVSAHAVSAENVDMYMREPNRWQDDPQRGGGSIITMGIHALEMLVVLLGPRIRRVSCLAGKRVYLQSASEDIALVRLEWEDGLLGAVDVVCGVNVGRFSVELFGSQASLRCTIPAGSVCDFAGAALGEADAFDEYGYTGTIETFLEMCRTRVMPIPLEESAAIARVLLAARLSAATGQTITLDELEKAEAK
jgi:predicted dehydrogenase